MVKFSTITSTAIPLNIENIDTDQIIPARFLKATDRNSFGENLFSDWRYDEAGMEKDFILNKKSNAQILIVGYNFGCGSSREHAAWALYDYGFKAIISSFFADIFKGNALNTGLLPIQVSKDQLSNLFTIIEQNPTTKFTVNLEKETLSSMALSEDIHFGLDSYKKMCLLNGYDDLDFLLSKKEKIDRFELGAF